MYMTFILGRHHSHAADKPSQNIAELPRVESVLFYSNAPFYNSLWLWFVLGLLDDRTNIIRIDQV